MERKVIPFELAKLDMEGRIFEGYAAVFGNIDLTDDIIHPGAFTKTLAERGAKVKVLWQHDVREPIGRPLELREDARGLYIKGLISDTQRGRDALALLRDGALDSMSIGYDAIAGGTDYTEVDGYAVRNLREVRLWEVSVVTFSANEEARVLGLKELKPYPNEHSCRLRDPSDFQEDSFRRTSRESGGKTYHVVMGRLEGETTMTEQSYRYPIDGWSASEARSHCSEHDGSKFEVATGGKATEEKGVIPFQDLPLAGRDRAWDAAAAVGRVRTWAGGPAKDDIDWGRYRRAFVWYDAGAADNFTIYKLPIADVIDGTLTAVPRGIFACAVVIQGGRGGVDMPSGDVAAAKRHLARYYRKLDETPPWEKAAKEMTETGPQRRLVDQIVGYTRSVTDGMLDGWLADGLVSLDEHIMLRRIMDDHLMGLVMAMPQEIGARLLMSPGLLTFAANDNREIKVGRRLSAASVDKIQAAIDALRVLLAESGAQEESEEEQDEQQKSVLGVSGASTDDDTAPSQNGTDTVAPTAKAAGPDMAPPSSGYEALKKELDEEYEQFVRMFGGVK